MVLKKLNKLIDDRSFPIKTEGIEFETLNSSLSPITNKYVSNLFSPKEMIGEVKFQRVNNSIKIHQPPTNKTFMS
jgi:hypothetical protein